MVKYKYIQELSWFLQLTVFWL